ASAVAGGSAFVLSAVGGRFYPDSKIVWGGTPLTTQFINEHELRANVSAGLVAVPGNANVLVRNTAPGGGDSAAQVFASTAPGVTPVPSIDGTVPAEIT